MTFALAGFAIIALAWLIQLGSSWKGRPELRRSFVLLYGVGAAVMVAGGSQGGFNVEGWLQLLILIFVALLYVKMHD